MKSLIFVLLIVSLAPSFLSAMALNPNQGISNVLVSSIDDDAKKRMLYAFYEKYKNDPTAVTGAIKSKIAKLFNVKITATFDADLKNAYEQLPGVIKGGTGTGVALDDAIKTAIANVANKTGSVEDAMKAIGRTSGKAIVTAINDKVKAGAAFDALKAEALK